MTAAQFLAKAIYKEIGDRFGEVSTFKRIRALSDP
jgi:hypothetical protein